MGIHLWPRARLRRVPEVDPIHAERLRELTKQLDVLEDALSIGQAELATEMRAAHDDGWTYYQIAQVTGFSQPRVKRWIVGEDFLKDSLRGALTPPHFGGHT